MNDFLKRLIVSIGVAAFTVALVAPTTASATAAPWTWTDASSQISVRTNRPVWAMAHAGSSWFYTDGQDLASGGHVWTTDGKTSKDITAQIRKAGLTRVDDIVSDGKTVLFLKNVTSNQIEAVSYTDRATNVTSILQQSLGSNERVSTITGKNGSWNIVTNRGHLLAWDGSSVATRIAFPDSIQMLVNADAVFSNGSTQYFTATNGMRAFGSSHLSIATLNGSLLLAVRTSTATKFYLYDGTTFTDVTAQFPVADTVDALSSNGTTALALISHKTGNATTQSLVTFDGAKMKEVALPITISTVSAPQMIWTGASWMILSEKNIYRLSGDAFESYGQTRDYFTTISADGNGSVLLAGAVSNAASDGPTSPLTAKIANVWEEAGKSIATETGTTFWTWLEPNMTALRRDQSTTYDVGAWNAKGIQRIEIYVNWTLRKACDFGATNMGNQTCVAMLNGVDYAPNTTISMIAKITDTNGKVTWTPFSSLIVKDAAFAAPVNTNPVTTQPIVSNGVSVWTWLEPNVSSLTVGGRVTLKAQANAADGLNRIELYVNDSVRKICDFGRSMGTQDCEVTLTGSDYANGAVIPTYAKATSASGATTASTIRKIDVRDNLKDAGQKPATVTTWMSPEQNTLRDGEAHTFFAQAQDFDGLDHVDILVDDVVKQTCTYTNAYDARDCSLAVNASQYPNVSSVNISTRVTDAKGFVTWGDTRNYALWH